MDEVKIETMTDARTMESSRSVQEVEMSEETDLAAAARELAGHEARLNEFADAGQSSTAVDPDEDHRQLHQARQRLLHLKYWDASVSRSALAM